LDFSEEVAQTTEFEVIEPQTAEPEKQPAKKSDAPF